MRNKAIILLIFFIINGNPVFCCSAFTATQGKVILMGGNTDDYPRVNADCWVVAPQNGKYGYFFMRAIRDYYLPMNGMNEKGLFFDMAGIPQNLWKRSANKLNYPGYLHEKMMQDCATVEDAIKLYTEYNAPHLQWGHIMVVDSTGDSVIIEWDVDDVAFIRKQQGENYQLMTNFFLLHPERGHWPCQRYTKAKAILDSAQSYDWELFRQVHLTALSQSSTTYSTIASPTTREIFVFFKRNFKEYATFNVIEELNRPDAGVHTDFANLFANIDILSPKQGELVDPGSVTVQWKGNADKTYEIIYSDIPSELDSSFGTIIKANISNGSQHVILILLICLFGGFCCLLKQIRAKHVILAVFLLILPIILLSNCDTKNENDSNDNQNPKQYSFTINNLISGTTYYWKVKATSSSGRTTESIIYNFKTR
jgi:hypothetical protein